MANRYVLCMILGYQEKTCLLLYLLLTPIIRDHRASFTFYHPSQSPNLHHRDAETKSLSEIWTMFDLIEKSHSANDAAAAAAAAEYQRMTRDELDDNTYILTTDADMEFDEKSVFELLDLMKQVGD